MIPEYFKNEYISSKKHYIIEIIEIMFILQKTFYMLQYGTLNLHSLSKIIIF